MLKPDGDEMRRHLAATRLFTRVGGRNEKGHSNRP
jgi:hypothetical protein